MDKIIAIYGPATSNKLGLALSLSKYVWGKYHIEPEVVNTDPRKIYKGFVISQSLPSKSFLQKVKGHLFGTVSLRKKLDLFDFQKLVKKEITEIQQRGNLPVLVGGSPIHLASVLQDWKKGEKQKRKGLPPNVLVFSLLISKLNTKKAISSHVSKMIKNGVYDEFRKLYQASQKGEVSKELLRETIGYRQFLEMAKVSGKSPLVLESKDIAKVKKWIIKDLLDFVYHQALGCKRFQGIVLVENFQEAREKLEPFVS